MPRLRHQKPRAKRPSQQQRDAQLGQMLINIYETGYLDRNTAYKQTFFKGVIGGFGGVLGATVLIALLLWVLTLFKEVPLVGHLTHNLQETIQTHQQK